MSSWQTALESAIAKGYGWGLDPTVYHAMNTEYLQDGGTNLHGGVITYCSDGSYSLANTHTRVKQENITADHVEQALVELNISNSDWV